MKTQGYECLLFLVRHGETAYNVEGRVQGQIDVPLTEHGITQAKLVAGRLQNLDISAVYSSDLVRATTTAEYIASHHELKVQVTPLLRELKLGEAEGLTKDDIAKRFPGKKLIRNSQTQNSSIPGIESHIQLLNRSRKFLSHVAKDYYNGENIVVIGHAGSLRGVILAACSIPIRCYNTLRVDNACLSVIRMARFPQLLLLNDTAHLSTLCSRSYSPSYFEECEI